MKAIGQRPAMITDRVHELLTLNRQWLVELDSRNQKVTTPEQHLKLAEIRVVALRFGSNAIDLIRAAAMMEPSTRPLTLIAGGDNYGGASRAYRHGLEDQVLASGLEHDVVLLGSVEHPEVILAATDVVAHPAGLPEAFGRVIVEAQLAGRPIVATALGVYEKRSVTECPVSLCHRPTPSHSEMRCSVCSRTRCSSNDSSLADTRAR